MSRKDQQTRFSSIMMLTGMFLLVMCGGALAAPQYTTYCNSCHGMPPKDTATADTVKRNPDTGAFQGNHSTHLPPGGTYDNNGSPCLPCHNTTGYTTSHMTGQINIQANINSSPISGGSKYMISGVQVTFKNQTSVPALGTCSSANCHFEKANTPTWGTADFSTTADCSQCHSVPSTSVPHALHGQYYGSVAATDSCTKCHPDYVTGLKFSHATSVSNRPIKVQLAEGSYAGGTNSTNYLPSQTGRTFGSCSNLYCHSPGDKSSAYNAPVSAATWGTTLTCAGCHKFDAASGNAINTPVAGLGHTKHVVSTMSSNIACYKCHAATATGANAISSMADHADKLVTVKFSNSTSAVNGTYNGAAASGASKFTRAPGITTGGACKNVYCHSDGTKSAGTFTVMSTARWGMALAANCTGCHGGDSTRPAARQMNTFAHNSHVGGGTQKAFGCADCHATTVSGNTTVSTLANHVDYKVNVSIPATWGGTYSADGHKPGAGTGTCSTVYCHSNGKGVYPATPATWATPSTGQCGTCHAVTPTIIASSPIINSNAHFDHLSSSFGPKMLRTEAGCALCHTYTTAVAATHVNKTVEAPLATCTAACHKQMATIQWNTSSVTCESCHTTTAGALSFISSTTAPDKTAFTSAGHGRTDINTASGQGRACVDCHDSRAPKHITGVLGDTNRVFAGLGTGDTRAACDYCHKSTNTAIRAGWRNMSTHFTSTGVANMACQVCHDPHGATGNVKMITSAIQFRTSSYAVTVTSIDTGLVNTTTNRGFCQVCHRTTKYWKKGIATLDHPSTGCFTANCHTHNAAGGAFVKDGSCNACHGYPPVPRNAAALGVTINTTGNYKDAQFENYTGGGGAHIVGKHVPSTVTAGDGWSSVCLTCHNGGDASSYHKKVLPIRSNVANVSIKIAPRLQYSRSVTFFGYTNAKLVNPPANKTGTCYNVSCHFTKSLKWSAVK